MASPAQTDIATATPTGSPQPISDIQAQMAKMYANGPPYVPMTAAIGGVPNDTLDLGISIMFIVIFATLAATHMSIFIRNKKRNHFFIQSAVTFGFCMSRIVTFALRAAWSKHQTNVDLAITAQVFVSAGVVLLYIINMIYANRIFRAYHPKHGNSKAASIVFKGYIVTIVLVIIMVIIVSVYSFFTRDPDTLLICQRVQKFGMVYFTVTCFLPIPIVLLSRYIPGSYGKEGFGKLGTLTHKCIVVLIASGLLTFGTAFRTGVSLSPMRYRWDPAWYHSKAVFYCVIPTIEVLVVILYAASRVDQRFYVGDMKKEVKDAQLRDLEATGDSGSRKSGNEQNER